MSGTGTNITFQPTRPLRGATKALTTPPRSTPNFNPRAPCGARLLPADLAALLGQFQPTRPLRGATPIFSARFAQTFLFQPTRPLRGATGIFHDLLFLILISTHAPLAGRDRDRRRLLPRGKYFNPRAPCGARLCKVLRPALFLPISTHAPLAGRDKKAFAQKQNQYQFQPTRPLRGATPAPELPAQNITISTHAPLAGRDF